MVVELFDWDDGIASEDDVILSMLTYLYLLYLLVSKRRRLLDVMCGVSMKDIF